VCEPTIYSDSPNRRNRFRYLRCEQLLSSDSLLLEGITTMLVVLRVMELNSENPQSTKQINMKFWWNWREVRVVYVAMSWENNELILGFLNDSQWVIWIWSERQIFFIMSERDGKWIWRRIRRRIWRCIIWEDNGELKKKKKNWRHRVS
jgi:hypothetical protein